MQPQARTTSEFSRTSHPSDMAKMMADLASRRNASNLCLATAKTPFDPLNDPADQTGDPNRQELYDAVVGDIAAMRMGTNTATNRNATHQAGERAAKAAILSTMAPTDNGRQLLEILTPLSSYEMLLYLENLHGGKSTEAASAAEEEFLCLRHRAREPMGAFVDRALAAHLRAKGAGSPQTDINAQRRIVNKINVHLHVGLAVRQQLDSTGLAMAWGEFRRLYVAAEAQERGRNRVGDDEEKLAQVTDTANLVQQLTQQVALLSEQIKVSKIAQDARGGGWGARGDGWGTRGGGKGGRGRGKGGRGGGKGGRGANRNQFHGNCYECGEWGHRAADCPAE